MQLGQAVRRSIRRRAWWSLGNGLALIVLAVPTYWGMLPKEPFFMLAIWIGFATVFVNSDILLETIRPEPAFELGTWRERP